MIDVNDVHALLEEVASDPAAEGAGLADAVRASGEFWRHADACAQLWDTCTVEIGAISYGIRERTLKSNCAERTAFACAYLRMLASHRCPVQNLFDTFTFSTCWQSLRDSMTTSSDGNPTVPATQATQADMASQVPEDRLALPQEQLQTDLIDALHASGDAFEAIGISARREALQAACEHLCAVYCTALKLQSKQKRGQTAKLGTIASLATKCFSDIFNLHGPLPHPLTLSLLRLLGPPLMGCLASATSGVSKPTTTIAEAAAGILRSLPACYDCVVLDVLLDAVLRAPDKAPLRNTVADAASAVVRARSTDVCRAWMQRVALMLHDPDAGRRGLAVQLLEPLMQRLLEDCGEGSTLGSPDGVGATNGSSRKDSAVLLVALVHARCMDKVSAVRARAMGTLTKLLQAVMDKYPGGVGQCSAILQPFLNVLSADSTCGISMERLQALQHGQQADSQEAGARAAEADGNARAAAAGNEGDNDNSHDDDGDDNGGARMQAEEGAGAAAPSAASQAPDAVVPLPLQLPDFLLTGSDCTPPGAAGAAASGDTPAVCGDMLQLLSSQAADSKANVRKSAVQLIATFVSLVKLTGAAQPAVLRAASGAQQLLQALLGDPGVSVRRAVVDAASHLLHAFPLEGDVANAWAKTVFGLAQDGEKQVAEAVQKEILTQLLQPACQLCSEGDGGARGPAPASKRAVLVYRIGAIGRNVPDPQPALRMCCQGLAARIRPQETCAALEQLLTDSPDLPSLTGPQRTFVWTLITEITSACQEGAPLALLRDSWLKLKPTVTDPAALAATAGGQSAVLESEVVLRAVDVAAAQFSISQVRVLAPSLYAALETCEMPCAVVAPAVRVMAKFSLLRGEQPWPRSEGGGRRQWQTVMFERCRLVGLAGLEAINGDSRQGECEHGRAVQLTAAALFTIGHVALEMGTRPNREVLELVQALTRPSLRPQQTMALSPKLTPSLPGGALHIPSQVQAHAWAALSKVSLVDEELGRDTAPLMIAELGRNRNTAVRNNVLVSLCDLCMQYTSVVESQLPQLTRCMQDPHPIARKQAIALMSTLLQKGFVKWRSSVFVQFLIALVDDSPTVRQVAAAVVQKLLQTSPTQAPNHMVEVVYRLNNCLQQWLRLRRNEAATGPTLGADDTHTGTGRLQGSTPLATQRRFVIYKVLLKDMSVKHKMAVVDKLVDEVVNPAADKQVPLQPHESFSCVIADVLALLTLPEAQLTDKTAAAAAAALDDDADEHGSQAEGKKKVLLDLVAQVRQSFVERVVPAFASLKATLELEHNPLQQQVMDCLVDLLQEYKKEMEQHLEANQQLAAEIRFHSQERVQAGKPRRDRARLSIDPQTPSALTTLAGLPAATPQVPRGTASRVRPWMLSALGQMGAVAPTPVGGAPAFTPVGASSHTVADAAAAAAVGAAHTTSTSQPEATAAEQVPARYAVEVAGAGEGSAGIKAGRLSGEEEGSAGGRASRRSRRKKSGRSKDGRGCTSPAESCDVGGGVRQPLHAICEDEFENIPDLGTAATREAVLEEGDASKQLEGKCAKRRCSKRKAGRENVPT